MRSSGSLRFGAPIPDRGFTVIELLVTVVVFAIVALLTVPNFISINARRALEGSAEQTAALLRKARYDAIRSGRAVEVALDEAQRSIFVDLDGDRTLDPVELREGVVRLPRGVEPGGPAGDAAAVTGFTLAGGARAAVLEPTGALQGDGGAFRLHDRRDNYLEVRVSEPATALVELFKWQDGGWLRRRQGGESWRWNP